MVIRVGRYVACPDIETQLAPDNYLGSHSILFTYDTYTQTGVMVTVRPQQQWLLQAGINCGDDMAPWYPGATACRFLGARWVAKDNNDAIYACLNQFNNAQFRHFDIDGQAAGHDNYNYFVATWEHRFSPTSTPRPKRISCGNATPSWEARQSLARRNRSPPPARTTR